MKNFFLILILLLPVLVFAKGIQADIFNQSPSAGDTVLVKFSDRTLEIASAFFDGKPISFFSYKTFPTVVLGVAVTKPAGRYLLRVDFKNGQSFNSIINVKNRKVVKIVLGEPKESEIKLSELGDKVQEKKLDLDTIFKIKTPNIFFKNNFGLPLMRNRVMATPFGAIYKTGSSEIRHLGTDFAASIGAFVGAINDGVIRKAYFDNIYGNSVIIDHGEGIYSYYIHMNEIKIKEGALVKKGTVIGTVGQTGYATGPHLHLSVKVGGVAVDPVNFVAAFR